jgi:CheY-like chemotaxis protein
MSIPTSPAPPLDQAAHDEPSLQGLQVLLADDQVINVMIIGKLLAQLGCSMERVENGQQAVERWQQGGLDLILMDLQMPVMGGLDATRRIRELEHAGAGSGHVPIVAVTASALEQDRERCLAAGMDAHLARPVALDRLAQVMRAALRLVAASRTTGLTGLAATAPPEEPDAMDLEQLRSNLDHDEELLQEFAVAMRREIQQRLERLQQAGQSADAALACAQAHALRGGLGSIGATQAVALTRSLEHSAAAGDWGQFQHALTQLQPRLQAIESALAVYG